MLRPLKFVILTSDPDDAQELLKGLDTDTRVRIVASSDNAERVYAEVVRWRPPAVIITHNREQDPDWTLCRQIYALYPDTTIICASRDSSPDLILDSLRAGAREFLRLPIIADELKTVIDRAFEFCAGETKATKKRGRVVAVFSNKGGCGSSFIAANLAAAMGANTVLADLNLQAASQDLFFGVKPRYSIVDMIDNRARLDDQLLSSYLVECLPSVFLLSAPHETEAADEIIADHVVEVIDILRERFDFVTLDLSHTFDAITIAALDQADEILLVMTLDILATRSAQRALAIFRRLGYAGKKVRIVLNRWNKQSDLELSHVEKFLGERITSFVSEDYRSVVSSINVGQPLVASNASATIAVELRRLAAVCSGNPDQSDRQRRKNFFNTLFRRQTLTEESKIEGVFQNP